MNRRTADAAIDQRPQLDLVGTLLSAVGMALIVFGILRAGAWGIVTPKSGGPTMFGLSPVVWLLLGGGVVLRLFLTWTTHRTRKGLEPLVDLTILRNRTLVGGLLAFFFQFLVQMGLFFVVPLFLSVALGLSAVETGVRLLPLSLTLLLAAAGIPKVFPNASPRRVAQLGFVSLFAGIVVLMVLLDVGAGAEIITWPMLLAGLGIGALASQLGGVTVSSVPGRAQRRGRRDPEHDDQPRSVDRHRGRGRDPDRRARRARSCRDPDEPGRSRSTSARRPR